MKITAKLVTLLVWGSAVSAAAGSGPTQDSETVHRLKATPKTVAWGHFDARLAPVLRVESGDVVDVDSLITAGPDYLESLGAAPGEIQGSLRAIHAEVSDRGPGGHIVTGPIWVEGAQPGDALEIRILDVDLVTPYGYHACNEKWTYLPENCVEPRSQLIRFDMARMVAPLGSGIEVPLRPFFGILGVAPPPEAGRVSSNPPDRWGGNIDNKELVAGTTLFLPVFVPGANLFVGDSHAAQGDGEVGGTALESSVRGRLKLIVRKDLNLRWPRAETSSHFIAMGSDPDLDKATRIAVQEAIDFLVETWSMTPVEANRLASMAADIRMTQIVDDSLGVHVMLPKSIFTKR